MKNLLLFLTISTLMINCSSKKGLTTESDFVNGWYFVTESMTDSKTVKSAFDYDTVRIEKNPILKASEYSKIGVLNQIRFGEEVTFIEIIFSGKQKEIWKNATARMTETREKAVFIYKNKYIATISAIAPVENGYTSIMIDENNDLLPEKILTELKKEKVK